MALTILGRLVGLHMVSKSEIGLINVGGGERLDRSKSVKSELMAAFEADGALDIEGLDMGTSPQSGFACLQACLDWTNSAAWDGRWAVAITIDAASVPFGSTPLDTLAGAVGVLVGPDAPVVLSPMRAARDSHAWTVFRPVGGQQLMTQISALDEDSTRLHEQVASTHGLADVLCAHDHVVFCMHGARPRRQIKRFLSCSLLLEAECSLLTSRTPASCQVAPRSPSLPSCAPSRPAHHGRGRPPSSSPSSSARWRAR